MKGIQKKEAIEKANFLLKQMEESYLKRGKKAFTFTPAELNGLLGLKNRYDRRAVIQLVRNRAKVEISGYTCKTIYTISPVAFALIPPTNRCVRTPLLPARKVTTPIFKKEKRIDKKLLKQVILNNSAFGILNIKLKDIPAEYRKIKFSPLVDSRIGLIASQIATRAGIVIQKGKTKDHNLTNKLYEYFEKKGGVPLTRANYAQEIFSSTEHALLHRVSRAFGLLAKKQRVPVERYLTRRRREVVALPEEKVIKRAPIPAISEAEHKAVSARNVPGTVKVYWDEDNTTVKLVKEARRVVKALKDEVDKAEKEVAVEEGRLLNLHRRLYEAASQIVNPILQQELYDYEKEVEKKPKRRFGFFRK